MFAVISTTLRKLDEDQFLLVIGLLIIVLGSCAFVALAYEVSHGKTQHFDEAVIRSIREDGKLSEFLEKDSVKEIIRDVTALGGHIVLLLSVAAVAAFLRLDGKKGDARFVIGAALSGYVLGTGLKAFFARPRPNVVPLWQHVRDSSFPSGHAMMSAIIYLTFAVILSRLSVSTPRLRSYFVVVALLLTGLIGTSRVFMGVHYPTDVLAGWTVGVVWATLCWLIARRLQRRGMLEA